MPPAPIIASIDSLKGLGVFHNYVHPKDGPRFERRTLIYGFNGSGKTTLSRIFSSIQNQQLRPELPVGGAFRITLSDGTQIEGTAAPSGFRQRLHVFNIDFVEDNIRWKEGKANPVFYIGKTQAELAEQLRTLQSDLAESRSSYRQAKSNQGAAELRLSNLKRDQARIIAQSIGLGRNYNATHLERDYHARQYDHSDILPDEDQLLLGRTANQDVALAKLSNISDRSADFARLVEQVRAVLSMTVGDLAVSDLQSHQAMLTWIREGLNYHEEHVLDTCLLCGNIIPADRQLDLRKTIDGSFADISSRINRLKTELEQSKSEIENLSHALPAVNDLMPHLHGEFPTSAAVLRKTVGSISENLTSLTTLLESKIHAPGSRLDGEVTITSPDASALDDRLLDAVKELNAVIDAHNASHDDFAKTKATAQTRLKNHYLAEGQRDYEEARADAAKAKDRLTQLENHGRELAQKEDDLKNRIREHGPAADAINRLIRDYLGHGQLQVSTLDEGYQITRSGQSIVGPASEGEKTAVALCYFLSTIESDGRTMKDQIVVIDDPISSLDSRALNYSCSILQKLLSNAAQLILFTHNLHFANEMKKWLKPQTASYLESKKSNSDPSASLLFLDLRVAPAGDLRTCSIAEMPKLIREHDSEYHYLVSLAMEYQESEQDLSGLGYMIPNALRKILDVFLTFKLPNVNNFTQRIDHVVRDESIKHGLGDARVKAVSRLLQLESHSDLDDLVGFSPMNIEEARDATSSVLALIAHMDSEHWRGLERACRPGRASAASKGG